MPPDVAFHLSSHIEDAGVLQLRWVIADGYFIYRDKIQVRAASPDLVVGPPILPSGTRFDDKNFGLQEVYFQQATVSVPFTRSDYGAHPLQIQVTYQGCAQSGFCYPPISKVLFPESGAGAISYSGFRDRSRRSAGGGRLERLGSRCNPRRRGGIRACGAHTA